MLQSQVGFIGGGQMAAALIGGAIRAGILHPQQLTIIETSQLRCQQLKQMFPLATIHPSATAAAGCHQVVLAVKPQILREIGNSLASQLGGDPLWISIAAGVGLGELQSLLGSQRIVRVMPNTPVQVGAGAAALTALAQVSEPDIAWVERLMESVGICHRVAESQMHAVTGIAGSSPAYVYLLIEAMADAGVSAGLAREMAIRLSAQSFMGAAQMVLESELHPAQLKDQVVSPGGTTIAALRELEAAAVRSAIMDAVAACIRRSRELESPST